jgi:hypothetical protein
MRRFIRPRRRIADRLNRRRRRLPRRVRNRVGRFLRRRRRWRIGREWRIRRLWCLRVHRCEHREQWDTGLAFKRTVIGHGGPPGSCDDGTRSDPTHQPQIRPRTLETSSISTRRLTSHELTIQLQQGSCPRDHDATHTHIRLTTFKHYRRCIRERQRKSPVQSRHLPISQ